MQARMLWQPEPHDPTIAGGLTLTTYEELKKTISVDAVYLLSDSEIVLNWLENGDPSKVTGVLVSDRVKEIKRITTKSKEESVKMYFGYITDCATRGLTAEELYEHTWWKGPEFFPKEQKDWREETRLFEILLETADPLQISVQKEETTLVYVDRFSCTSKLRKTVTYVLKFLNRTMRNLPDVAKDRIRKIIGMEKELEAVTPIEAAGMRHAEKIVKAHQKQYHSTSTADIQRKLNITPDSNGIWRCHGRLEKSRLTEEAEKKSIFIAPNNSLANLIIQEAHGRYHCSTAHTMAEVRKRFWIPKLRQQVKKVIKKCTACQRCNNLLFRYPSLAE
ncbi:hypothetical protein ANCDUO_00305 [Ancylostoma duodenale]|uniref:Integrase zinc-binding domain-containing protein n=1 Tax=Ancylostoma duodenale TaxID=51022 RepID=A0A0C2HIF6_9BILA|nr:hypothetical protein ANCDUO_00305 [Ancylostoma duodenale]